MDKHHPIRSKVKTNTTRFKYNGESDNKKPEQYVEDAPLHNSTPTDIKETFESLTNAS